MAALGLAAVLRAGFAVVNVNPLYTPRELEHQLKDSGAEAIIVLENFATTVQQNLIVTVTNPPATPRVGRFAAVAAVVRSSAAVTRLRSAARSGR